MLFSTVLLKDLFLEKNEKYAIGYCQGDLFSKDYDLLFKSILQ